MKAIKFVSDKSYKVTKVLRKSKARYAKGISLGDVITLSMYLTNTKGASGGGRYSIYFDVYSNGKLVGEASQVEILNLFAVEGYNKSNTIFEVVELTIR